jgi:hypothetical protein
MVSTGSSWLARARVFTGHMNLELKLVKQKFGDLGTTIERYTSLVREPRSIG